MKDMNNQKLRLPIGAAIALILWGIIGFAPAWNASAQAQEIAAEEEADAVDTNEATVEVEGQSALIYHSDRERVRVGGNLRVSADEVVQEAVTVFGSAEVAGEVKRDMATVFGGAKMTGSVGHDMVTVFGDAEVDGPVEHDLVVVFGSLKLGPNADVGHDVVVVFGSIEKDPEARLAGELIEVLPWFSGVGDYIKDGLLWGRLIPPSSGLAWIVVGLHFLLYLIIVVLMPKPVSSCVEQLDGKPLQSFGVGLLTMVLIAPVFAILAATGVGAILIPFLVIAEVALVLLGKTATFEFLGLQIFRGFNRNAEMRPLPTFLVGFILITLLYMVPVLALVVYMLIKPFALGAAVLAFFASIRKNGNGAAPGVPMSPPVVAPLATGGVSAASSGPVTEPAAATDPPSTLPPVSVAVMPRAGFWIRFAATALDFLALCWLLMLPHVDSYFLFFWLTYHIGMWAWKGTTIGGIVCNLRVVRVDGRRADFAVCLVRGLAGVFSALPLLLGFFWVGWTSERQSWHDKIAGTVIVRVPKNIPLL